jgi:type IV pilus assembly protein PilO
MNAKELVSQESRSAFLEKIEKLALWQRVAIVAAVLVLLCGAAVWFLFLPKWDEITILEQRVQALEKKLATAKINAAELGKFQVKMQEAEAQFKIAMRALPENQEIPSLLTSISKSGQEVGLEFLLFEPKIEIKKEFYAEIPVAMSIRGDYHNLVIFFDKVARLSRIVNITDIVMTPIQEGHLLITNCNAITYKFVESPPAVAPRPAAGNPAPKPNAGQEDAKSKPKANKKNL